MQLPFFSSATETQDDEEQRLADEMKTCTFVEEGERKHTDLLIVLQDLPCDGVGGSPL